MSGETTLTIIGNLTADPELRFTPSGDAVANFTVASTPRSFNRQSQEWEDGTALFLRCSVWRQQAENVAESLSRGVRVVVTGRLKQRSYDKDGQKHTVVEMEADEVAPSLRYVQVAVHKTERARASAGTGGGGGGGFGGGRDDPWATGTAQQGDGPAF